MCNRRLLKGYPLLPVRDGVFVREVAAEVYEVGQYATAEIFAATSERASFRRPTLLATEARTVS